MEVFSAVTTENLQKNAAEEVENAKEKVSELEKKLEDRDLDFDRKIARGMRLDIAAGTAVRFEPGQTREIQLIAIAGARRVFGFNAQIMGDL